MSDHDLDQIAEIINEKKYSKDDIIIREKTSAGMFYIIHHGMVEISKKFEDGEELVIAVHSDGEFFGEMAILDEGPRSATARAVQPTVLLEISGIDFETLLYKAPNLAYIVMRELSLRLRETGALMVSHLQRKNRHLQQAYLDTITAMVNTIEARDSYTKGHTYRVTAIAKAIGRKMGLTYDELYSLEIGALLHDVGLIRIPDVIRLKAGPLEHKEYEQIKEHPQIGKDMMNGIDCLEQAIPVVLHHHERFDGKGYPKKLSGDNIPLAGRIISVADAFDAITSDRPYRKSMDYKEAFNEIKKGSNQQFDPKVVTALIKLWKDNKLEKLLK